MTEATREQLMILVERVVRPIRTVRAQKKRIREDLWSHAVAAFEEELEESKDESAALSRVQDRLGNPHELTAQLQKDVPRQCVFSYHFEQWLNARPDESIFRTSLRQGFVSAFLPALIIVMASLSSNDRRPDNLTCLLASVTTVTGTIILAFLFYIVRNALFLAPLGSRTLRIILFLTVSCLLIVPIWLLYQFLAGAVPPKTLIQVQISTVTTCVLVPLMFLGMARKSGRLVLASRTWEHLQID